MSLTGELEITGGMLPPLHAPLVRTFTHVAMLLVPRPPHVAMLFPSRSSHLMMFFTSPFRTEMLTAVMHPIPLVVAELTIAVLVDPGDFVPPQFGRKFPRPHPDPVVPIVGSAVPPPPSEEVVNSIVIEKIIRYANRHSEPQLRWIEKVRRLRHDHRGPSHVNVETNVGMRQQRGLEQYQ
jgi:hypothetical protein